LSPNNDYYGIYAYMSLTQRLGRELGKLMAENDGLDDDKKITSWPTDSFF
jgi:hypothetical protein